VNDADADADADAARVVAAEYSGKEYTDDDGEESWATEYGGGWVIRSPQAPAIGEDVSAAIGLVCYERVAYV
jgi:hypothetical protein